MFIFVITIFAVIFSATKIDGNSSSIASSNEKLSNIVSLVDENDVQKKVKQTRVAKLHEFYCLLMQTDLKATLKDERLWILIRKYRELGVLSSDQNDDLTNFHRMLMLIFFDKHPVAFFVADFPNRNFKNLLDFNSLDAYAKKRFATSVRLSGYDLCLSTAVHFFSYSEPWTTEEMKIFKWLCQFKNDKFNQGTCSVFLGGGTAILQLIMRFVDEGSLEIEGYRIALQDINKFKFKEVEKTDQCDAEKTTVVRKNFLEIFCSFLENRDYTNASARIQQLKMEDLQMACQDDAFWNLFSFSIITLYTSFPFLKIFYPTCKQAGKVTIDGLASCINVETIKKLYKKHKDSVSYFEKNNCRYIYIYRGEFVDSDGRIIIPDGEKVIEWLVQIPYLSKADFSFLKAC